MPDLWPDEFNDAGLAPPLSVLKEQAEALGSKTKHRVFGRVMQVVDNTTFPRPDFIYNFDLVAPVLEDYSFTLFRASHDIDLYPVVLRVDGSPTREIKCLDQDQFLKALGDIFSSPKTKKIVGSLLSQTAAAMAKSK